MTIDNPNTIDGMAAIQVHFKHPITENCEKFLNAVQDQVGQLGVKIEARVGE